MSWPQAPNLHFFVVPHNVHDGGQLYESDNLKADVRTCTHVHVHQYYLRRLRTAIYKLHVYALVYIF
jgi:hypothetical protein